MEPPYSHSDPGGGLGAVAETVWCPPAHVRVPAALVLTEDEVLIPLMNYGAQAVTVDKLRLIAVLDEAVELSEEVGGCCAEVVRSVGTKDDGNTADDRASTADDHPPLPEFLSDLLRQSTMEAMTAEDRFSVMRCTTH